MSLHDAAALLDGIKGEADEKILAIGSQAEVYRQRLVAQARAKADSLLAEARRASSARAAALRAAAESRLSSERAARRRSAEEGFSKLFFEILERRLEAKPEASPRALDIEPHLHAWLVEAIIGLNEPQAVLSVSEGEKAYFTPSQLRGAENEALQLAGVATHVELSPLPLGQGRGLVLASPDGKVRFDNRLGSRLARAKSSIRNIIADEFSRASVQEGEPQ